MAGRSGRAALAMIFLSTLLIPAVGSIADPKSQLEKTQSELDRLRNKISEHESEAQSLEASIDDLNAQITAARNEVSKLNERVATIESKVRSAQAAIDRTQARIDKIESIAKDQAVLLYKEGSTETLDAILNSESLSELDARVELLGVAAQQNTGALIQYGRLKAIIESQHRELFNRKQELDATINAREKVLEGLHGLYERHSEELASLEIKLGEEHAHEGSLEDAARRISARILEKQTLHSVAILGKSDQGFIWPLNGAINSYYGPRWGRMHTGIDIDGVTGDPIVASKSGRVILSEYYSGYGNAIIIDHGGGIATLYGHLSAFDVRSGQDVAQGEIIGRVGCTGSCTGDHLHFEVRVNGSPVDPLRYLP